MPRDDAAALDPNQPALVVTYGNTAKRHRPLDTDLIVLGRSPVCNLNLVAPDVAPVHCVIARVQGGWLLRDCSGRPGTRINGESIKEAMVQDGDVVQVGSFSFEMRLPRAAPQPEPLSPSRVKQLEESRRRLAQVALRYRKRLATLSDGCDADLTDLQAQRSELNQQVDLLRNRQRDYELRVTRLELSERDLMTDRATLDKEYRAFVEDTDRHATAVKLFAERSAAREKELKAWAEELERQGKDKLTSPRAETPASQPEETGERERILAHRERELDFFAQHLKRQQDALQNPTLLVKPLAEQAKISQPEPEETLVAHLRTLFAEQREHFQSMLGQARPAEDILRPLQAEIDRLSNELTKARRQREEALQILDDRTRTATETIEAKEREIARLAKQVQPKRTGPIPTESGVDVQAYEAELNRFRQELEKDRSRLESEIQQARQRREELEEAIRESELQLSRERAQVARERVELERLRDEVRMAQERKRELSIRERLGREPQANR